MKFIFCMFVSFPFFCMMGFGLFYFVLKARFASFNQKQKTLCVYLRFELERGLVTFYWSYIFEFFFLFFVFF